MFFDQNHPHHVGVPELFPEKSLYKNAMLLLAMGITTKQLLELNNSTLDERGLWNLVNGIAGEVQAKRVTLETVYGLRGRDDADKTGLSITGVGRRFKKPKEGMVSKAGKSLANQKIDQHTGVYLWHGRGASTTESREVFWLKMRFVV
jgi:hypothetical protein